MLMSMEGKTMEMVTPVVKCFKISSSGMSLWSRGSAQGTKQDSHLPARNCAYAERGAPDIQSF
jgi:hypothetical protein